MWESGVLIARQILRYLNSLDKREEACNAYFKYFLDMWSIGLVSPATGPTKGSSSSGKRKRRESISWSVLVSNKSKEDQKEENFIIIDDPKSPIAKGELVVTEQELKESDDESNLSEIVGSTDGIRKIGKLWLLLSQI